MRRKNPTGCGPFAPEDEWNQNVRYIKKQPHGAAFTLLLICFVQICNRKEYGSESIVQLSERPREKFDGRDEEYGN